MDTKPFGFIGSLISSIGIMVSVGEVESVISIICSVVGLLLTITAVVIIPVWKWWKKAKADNQITVEELEELEGIIKNADEKLDSNKGDSKK